MHGFIKLCKILSPLSYAYEIYPRKWIYEIMIKSNEAKSFKSIWDALEDTPEEAQNMKIRSSLAVQIIDYIKKRELTQSEAAKMCHITQPRMSDLFHGKLSKFSLDALVNIAACAGLSISVNVNEEEFL